MSGEWVSHIGRRQSNEWGVGVSHRSPSILRAPDIAPDLSYAVFLQNISLV